MKTFVALMEFAPDALEKRAPLREEHLRRFMAHRDAGKIVAAGPWAEAYDGALIIFRADSQEDVDQFIRDDPYYAAGLWPSYRVREWNPITLSTDAFGELAREAAAS